MYTFPVQSIRQTLAKKCTLQNIVVNGWIRSIRNQKSAVFLDINDGSTLEALQVLVTPQMIIGLTTGASVRIRGNLAKCPSTSKAGQMELVATETTVWGSTNDYPLHKGRLPMDFLRSHLHLRSRTKTFGAVWRIRDSMYRGIHDFYSKLEFYQVTTPVLTGNDCEGGGDAFRVTTAEVIQNITKTNTGLPEFFDKPVYATVSGQLHAEFLASALSRVYTLGPTFRAEKSDSTRHLAEFWMLEAEMAFITETDQLVDFIEAQTKHIISHILRNSVDDLEFLDKYVQKGLIAKLETYCHSPFQRVSYTEAIQFLLEQNTKWEFKVEWGKSLQTEHEKFIAKHYNSPVFITDYPASIKPFYMKKSGSTRMGATVACTDLIFPDIGEVVGGSLREDQFSTLESNMNNQGIPLNDYQWYLDLRKNGSVPHGGFGMGVERLLAICTGVLNLRDLIPVPRYYHKCDM